MSYKTNEYDPAVESEASRVKQFLDRQYHNSETFLYRHRWGIVLLLVVLLAYYLYVKSESNSISLQFPLRNPIIFEPKLGSNDLNLGNPSMNVDTDIKQLFRL